MILLDESVADSVIATHAGRRCVEVIFSHRMLPGVFFVLGAHFPHKSSGEQFFQDALLEVEGATDRASSADVIIFAGDWNCQQGDQRFLELTALLHSKGFSLAYPESDTWVGALSTRRYDYFFVKVKDRGSLQYLDTGDVICVAVNDTARQKLASDHALVSLDLLLAPKGPRLQKQRDRRPTGWRKACVKTENFEEAVALLLTPTLKQDMVTQWEALQHLSHRCCVARGSLKYNDSPFIKELCRQGRCLVEPQARVRLSRVILAQRAHERRMWWAELESMAGNGDGKAIAFIRKRAQAKPCANGFVASAGGRTKAASQLEDHLKGVLASASTGELAKCAQLLSALQEKAEGVPTQPFSKQEVNMHIQRFLHACKTSGCSGVPAELVLAVANTDDGMAFLLRHLSLMLQDPSHLPSDYFECFVCLLPKKLQVVAANQFRPIALMETMLNCLGVWSLGGG